MHQSPGYIEITDVVIWNITSDIQNICPPESPITELTPTPASVRYYPFIIGNTGGGSSGYDIYITIGPLVDYKIGRGEYEQLPGSFSGRYLITARAYDDYKSKDILLCTGYVEITDVFIWEIPWPLDSLCDSLP
jgi:hypothetical protein